MKAINVTEFKAHLSKYLRMASRGALVVVKDRNEPLAQLGPPHAQTLAWQDRLAGEGRLRLGTQNRDHLRISKPPRIVDIQASLREVREDPSEVRRR